MAVVVSCLADELSALARLARSAARDADVVELRLDRLPKLGLDDERALAELVATLGKPVIAACNGPESYGHFTGTRAEQVERLRAAARAGASFLDVDWRVAADLGEPAGAARRIVSRHETSASAFEPERWLAELASAARPGELRKLVHASNNAEEALELLARLAGAAGELVAFSSGSIGSFSRVVAPLLGSPFTYAAPRRGEGPPTAPGQWPVDELVDALSRLSPDGFDLFGVVGRPIEHSLSPAVHGELLRAARRNALYVAFEAHDFERFARAARACGVRGLSITAPFKQDAVRLADEADPSARELGAANTWLATAHGWRASNTDIAGVHALFERAEGLLGRPLDGLELCVLGAGGAARALAAVARERGLRVVFAVRAPARAESLAARFGAEVVEWDALATRRTDVLVNATPVGWKRGESPLPAAWLRATLVVDSIYRTPESELLRTARERGLLTLGGETWFLAQAAEQARTFSGIEPDRLALLRSFRAAIGSIPTPE
ncbi:MAG: type I 3-dehydroquinate dehydratase [Planctomycetes bacterium]|nr:type I 3-dehydroquinate dehydratase [Planctomycetota bacterium]